MALRPRSQRGRLSSTALLAVAVVALLAGACGSGAGSGGDADGGSLEGVTWVLDPAAIYALVRDAPADARVDVRFEDGEVSGSSGCNTYGGTYEIDGSDLTFGPVGGTEMACEPASLMDLEAAYLAALGEVSSYRLKGDGLVLGGGATELTFAREEAAEPLPLVGTRWELESLAYGEDAVASPVAGTDAFVRFGADGDVAGSTGCNTFGGRYEVDGGAIGIGDMQMTLRACGSDVGQQEDVFQRALLRAATYEIEGDVLSLSDAAGAFLVSFVGRDGA